MSRVCRLIDLKSERRYDPCIKYTMVASKKALADAGLSREKDPDAFEKLDKTKVGVLVGSGMGGLQMFETGVEKLVTKVRLFVDSLCEAVIRRSRAFALTGKGGLQRFHSTWTKIISMPRVQTDATSPSSLPCKSHCNHFNSLEAPNPCYTRICRATRR